jgi:predicted small lipoprotein YifL
MQKTLTKAAATLMLTAALAACGDQAPAQAPGADDAATPLDEETGDSTDVDGNPSASTNGGSQMVGGSNDNDSARKPDPKRSKLIKADPD